MPVYRNRADTAVPEGTAPRASVFSLLTLERQRGREKLRSLEQHKAVDTEIYVPVTTDPPI